MSTDKEALARRAVLAWSKCGLNWLPGMEVSDDRHEFGDGTEPASRVVEVRGGMLVLAGWRNLDDHATLGPIGEALVLCLEAAAERRVP